MINRPRWFLWICGLILIGNFFIMIAYGDTLQSTHLFIVRSTVFYPVAGLNLIAGVILLGLLIRDFIRK
jgi:hypothetical protein